jgi:hypothetical protein
VDVDRGQLVGRGLKDVAVVMDLHKLAPVGGRAAGGRDGRRLERLADLVPVTASWRFPTFPIASDVTARLSLWLGANTP